MMIASIFFILNRILQILTLIPTMGMLVRLIQISSLQETQDLANDLAGLLRQSIQ